MENCLTDAAQLGWIDGIMATYNYRLMHTERMKKAVDACAKDRNRFNRHENTGNINFEFMVGIGQRNRYGFKTQSAIH